mmetsp:Transcript_960/g.1809  ORF Transcript_960/g.1809 Transcript_960/m.1809 type:complete len:130 (-) Transcript_960:123-512(-)
MSLLNAPARFLCFRAFSIAGSVKFPTAPIRQFSSTQDDKQDDKPDVDFYKVLGIPKSADGPRIKQAYLKKAALWHPDRNSHSPDLAKRKFDEVSEALSVLSCDDTRRLYDNGQYKRGSHVKKQAPRAGY